MMTDNFLMDMQKILRSQKGLSGAGEWHQLKPLLPDLSGKRVLDLGCGYGRHCKYAVECGAEQVPGIGLSEKMILAAKEKIWIARLRTKFAELMTMIIPEKKSHIFLDSLSQNNIIPCHRY